MIDASPLISLGPLLARPDWAAWLLRQAWQVAGPALWELTKDPQGTLGRIGDLVVWQSPKGARVVAVLEQLADSQERIEQAVKHLETGQLATAHSLGYQTAVSMATLGVASLSAGFILWRLQALNRKHVTRMLADTRRRPLRIKSELGTGTARL